MLNNKLVLRVLACMLFLSFVVVPVAYAQDGAGGDKFVMGTAYTLRSGESLPGNLIVMGGTATLEPASTVEGDVTVIGGELSVAGTVRGSVAGIGARVSLGAEAVVEGDVATFGGSIDRAPGAVVQGEEFQRIAPPALPTLPQVVPPPDFFNQTREPGSMIGRFVGWQVGTLAWGILMAILGMAAVLVAPKAIGRVSNAAVAQPAMSFGIGLLTVLVAGLAGGLLLIACGLGLLVWLALGLASLVGWIAIGLWLGQKILRAVGHGGVTSVWEVGLGVFLITLLSRLPWCSGFLFSVIAGSIGLGAVVLTLFGRDLRPQELEVAAPASGQLTAGDAVELDGGPDIAPEVVPDAEPGQDEGTL